MRGLSATVQGTWRTPSSPTSLSTDRVEAGDCCSLVVLASTALTISSWSTESKNLLTSKSIIQSFCQHVSRHFATASNAPASADTHCHRWSVCYWPPFWTNVSQEGHPGPGRHRPRGVVRIADRVSPVHAGDPQDAMPRGSPGPAPAANGPRGTAPCRGWRPDRPGSLTDPSRSVMPCARHRHARAAIGPDED